MNAIDIAILVVLAVLMLKGVWLGLIHELCWLAGLALGIVLAARFHASLAEGLPAWSALPAELAAALCFMALLLLTQLCFILLGMVLSSFLKLIFLGGFNRVLGALFGLCQGVLLLAVILYGISLTDWFKAARQASRLAPPFVVLGEQVMAGGQRLLR